MNLMKATVFFGASDASPSATYTVVASSARQAADLTADHLGLRQPWERIDVVLLANERVEGPARVLQPAAKGSAQTGPPSLSALTLGGKEKPRRSGTK